MPVHKDKAGTSRRAVRGVWAQITKGGLMREIVDFNHVPEHQIEIDKRLCNWERWVRVRPHGWQTHPMWRNSRTSRQWDISPHVGVSTDTLDAMLIEKAVSSLPTKQREALRWCYVHCNNPAAMARELAVSKQGLADLVSSARTMLTNTVKR